MSAPWRDWEKKPKISMMYMMPMEASEGPVTSAMGCQYLTCGLIGLRDAARILTGLLSANCFIFALLLVSLGDNGRNAATCCRVTVLSHGVEAFGAVTDLRYELGLE